jgi:hypothetical protein
LKNNTKDRGEIRMSVVITLEDIQAYAEVDYIIHHMNERYIEKVPTKLLDFFNSVKDPTYEVYVDPHIPLQNQGLKKYTLEILAILHVKYWCENEGRKAELLAKMQANQDKFEAQLKEKFSVENLFNNSSAKVINKLDDLENEKDDFSKPKSVTKYVIQNKSNEESNVNLKGDSNTDNTDNTNTTENTSSSSNENNNEKNVKKDAKSYPQKVEKVGIIARIKNFFFKNKEKVSKEK